MQGYHPPQRTTQNYVNVPAQGYPEPPQLGGFSDGSPSSHYLDHAYPCFLDFGRSSSSQAPQPQHPPQHATGLAYPEEWARDLYPQESSPYQYHLWSPPSDLERLSDPGPSVISRGLKGPIPQRFSTPTRPTPSEMAIILGPASRSDAPPRLPPPPPPMPHLIHEVDGTQRHLAEEEFTLARERKHACSMCHKRFDRPSTLRKHLLVHTGEKAFQCETCGRRFGVASNLNRHVRRCILKPVNALHSSSSSSSSSSNNNNSNSNATSSASPNSTITRGRSSSTDSSTRSSHPRERNHKRRRRAPSPSRWIPNSLRNFILETPAKSKTALMPLPPVRSSGWDDEERDSFDENVGIAPYHPREWCYRPKLPGPGFAGKDVRNINLGVGGGRVVVF